MKNKRLMGIIGLIAAAVIGTAIYSATAGKDNKAATSKMVWLKKVMTKTKWTLISSMQKATKTRLQP